jgi:hypothetical protein
MVLWFEKTEFADRVTSTYINRNMYATYAGFGLLCVGGLLFERTLSLNSASGNDDPSLRKPPSHAFNQLAALFASVLMLLAALAFTQSRGGAISSATSLSVLFLCLAIPKVLAKRGSLLWLATRLIGLWVLIYAATGAFLGQRFESEIFDPGGRVDGYKMTLRAIDDPEGNTGCALVWFRVCDVSRYLLPL